MDASLVQYVSRAGDFGSKGIKYHGTLKVLKTILGYEYLWNNIRVKGGAYGAMCGFSSLGNGYLSSYRDPNLKSTNEVYENVVDYIKHFDANDRDLTKYIIGTFSSLDKPLSPAGEITRSLDAYLTNIKFKDIQKERDQVLGTTIKTIRNQAKVLEAILDTKAICVIGNEKVLKENKEMFNKLENLL